MSGSGPGHPIYYMLSEVDLRHAAGDEDDRAGGG